MQVIQDTTVVVTSCGRHDLLRTTLESFFRFNTYPGIERAVVIEDGLGDPGEVCAEFGVELIRVGERIGQVRCIDVAYATVDTEYVFHLEDDWEFYRSGFIEPSKAFLQADPSTMLAWLRAWDDTNGHPITFKADDESMGVLAETYDNYWHGFTWNPALRRMSDYRKIGSFQAWRNEEYRWGIGAQHEVAAGEFYHRLGYRAVILGREGYVRHTGDGKHVFFS